MAKILVIEDRPELREGILELLETENFEAIDACTGEEGIDPQKFFTLGKVKF